MILIFFSALIFKTDTICCRYTSVSVDGPYLLQSSTQKMIMMFNLQVDESLRAEDVEIYYDPAELLGGLLKGTDSNIKQCPFHK